MRFLISFLFLVIFFKSNISFSEKLESIFITPDVFITSKIKPTTEYEGERGNILFEGHEIEKKENTQLVIC